MNGNVDKTRSDQYESWVIGTLNVQCTILFVLKMPHNISKERKNYKVYQV